MATKKEVLEKTQKAIVEFFGLAKTLLGEDAPFEITELPSDHPLYGSAKEMAEEMGCEWEDMTHDDSNSLILNLLSESFCNIKQDDQYEPLLTVSFKKSGKDGVG